MLILGTWVKSISITECSLCSFIILLKVVGFWLVPDLGQLRWSLWVLLVWLALNVKLWLSMSACCLFLDSDFFDKFLADDLGICWTFLVRRNIKWLNIFRNLFSSSFLPSLSLSGRSKVSTRVPVSDSVKSILFDDDCKSDAFLLLLENSRLNRFKNVSNNRMQTNTMIANTRIDIQSTHDDCILFF